MITPTAFWNMHLVGDNVIDPFGAYNLAMDAPDSVDMDLAAGKVGHAVTLDPMQSDWLLGANGLSVADFEEGFSFWFWVWRSSAGTNTCTLLHIVNDTGQELMIRWYSDDGMEIIGGDFASAAAIEVASDGNWHLVVVEYNAGDWYISAYVDNVWSVLDAAITQPNAGTNARWTVGNTDAADSDYDGGPIHVDAVGFVGYILSVDERAEIWNSGNGREYAPTDPALLPRQLLAEDSTTNVSDDMGGTPPASYELQSEVETDTTAVVTTTVSSSSAEGEVPQQQAILESTGGDELGTTAVAPGEEVRASVEVTGDDATVELRRTDE